MSQSADFFVSYTGADRAWAEWIAWHEPLSLFQWDFILVRLTRTGHPPPAKDPSGEHGLLLPVRVSDVEPPGLLKTRTYVDLVGRDANSARATLLAAARRVRGKPTSEPEFPGMPGPSVSHGTEAPQFPGQAEDETPTRSTNDLQRFGHSDLAPSSRPPQ